jgi:hypothetical protein
MEIQMNKIKKEQQIHIGISDVKIRDYLFDKFYYSVNNIVGRTVFDIFLSHASFFHITKQLNSFRHYLYDCMEENDKT